MPLRPPHIPLLFLLPSLREWVHDREHGMEDRHPRTVGAVGVIDLTMERDKKEIEREWVRECAWERMLHTLLEGERAKTEIPGACEEYGHARP